MKHTAISVVLILRYQALLFLVPTKNARKGLVFVVVFAQYFGRFTWILVFRQYN